MKGIFFPFILLLLTFCANNSKSINHDDNNKITILHFENLMGGHYIYKGIKVEITNNYDSIECSEEKFLEIDFISPQKKEYNFILPSKTNFKFISKNNELSLLLNEAKPTQAQENVVSYYNGIYSTNGLNNKIKKKYSDSLTLLSRSKKSEALYEILGRILNIRKNFIDSTFNFSSDSSIKNYLSNDLDLSFYNSFLRRGFNDGFTKKLIDSLFNSFRIIDEDTFFENPHYNLLFTRLITSSYSLSGNYSINSYAYDCFSRYLHPSVKTRKLKILVENALNNGDSTYALKFLSEYGDDEKNIDIINQLNSLRKNDPKESLFEDISYSKFNLSKFLSDNSYEYIVIDVWASWCSPCIEELKKFSITKQKLNSIGAQLIVISIDEKRDSWLAAHNRLNLPVETSFRIISNKKVFFNKEIEAIPYKFLMRKTGEIIDLGNEDPESYIKKILKK